MRIKQETRERLPFTVFITTTNICVSELNVLLVYSACSKRIYHASEAVNEQQFVMYVYCFKCRLLVSEKDPSRGRMQLI